MSLLVASLSFEMVAAVRPLVGRIKRYDRSLADQLVRAASSVALNIAEAEYSDPGNKRSRLFTAAGSANETRAALKLATAWGYLASADAEAALAVVGRVAAMLRGLTR
jgi:four helix bundle protein